MPYKPIVTTDDPSEAFYAAIHKLAEISLRFDYDDNTLALMVISARQAIRRAREIESSTGSTAKINEVKPPSAA